MGIMNKEEVKNTEEAHSNVEDVTVDDVKQTKHDNNNGIASDRSVYSNISNQVSSLLQEFKNNNLTEKDISIELEKVYKKELTSFGSKRVYARYGITKSGKILIDFKRNGRPVSLSLNECDKLNNILSSRNFENYIKSKKEIIEERNKIFFENYNKNKNDTNNETVIEESSPTENSTIE